MKCISVFFYFTLSLAGFATFSSCAKNAPVAETAEKTAAASDPKPAQRIEISDPQTADSAKTYSPAIGQLPKDAVKLLNIEYARTLQGPLFLDIYIPADAKEARPLIIWVHGGGWHVNPNSRNEFIPARMVGRGYVVASIGYRDSKDATFPAQIQDCKTAIRYLRARAKEYRIDPKRIGVWGVSAGGHLSALIGTSGGVKELEGGGPNDHVSSSVQAVCDFCGPTDFFTFEAPAEGARPAIVELKKELFGGTLEEKRDLAIAGSSITHVDPKDPPFLIMHGDADPLVHMKQSEMLYEALKDKGTEVTLAIIKGGGHMFWGPEVDRTIDAFFDKHLKGNGTK